MPSPSPDQLMRQFYRLALKIAAGWKASQKPAAYCDHDFVKQPNGTQLCWKCGAELKPSK